MTVPNDTVTAVRTLDDDELIAQYRRIERQRHVGIVGEADMELQCQIGFVLFERGYTLDDVLPSELREHVRARRQRVQ